MRRTDKLISEAKNHSLDEYMVHVEHWYQLYGNVDKKRVFIATDDPGVFKEAREKLVFLEIIISNYAILPRYDSYYWAS